MNILYIDAEPSNCAVVRDMLAAAGEQMTEARSLEEGLAILEDAEFQLIFVDRRIANTDGVNQLRGARAVTSVTRGPAIFVLSPGATTPGLWRLPDFGFALTGLIARPVTMDDLMAILGATQEALSSG